MKERFFSPSQHHLNQLVRTGREFAWRGQDFQTWQAALRARLEQMLGTFPDRKTPLDVEELEREETEGYVRIKIVFTAEECADVPAHLLVPKGREGPMPAMVCLQGHTPGMHISIGQARTERDREEIADDKDFAIQAVRRGFVALAIEQRCFGERAEAHQEQRWEQPCLDAVLHSLLLGRTMLGERVWDVVRAIDLLQEQPEVDNGRIACMGNSGGGKVTFYAACVEPRIKLAVVSCSFCAYADSIMRIRHCSDNYIPGMLRVAEMGELAGLVPPRKLLIVAGKEDAIFPVEGVKKAFDTARRIFAAAGCSDNLRLVVGPEGHRFYADPAWPLVTEMLP